MAKYLIQIIVLGTQAVGKAFAKALRQEYQASQAAAGRRTTTNSRPGTDAQTSAENLKAGLSLEEARQILNVTPESTPEEIQQKYEHLFNANDKSKGGSFYLQSKVFFSGQRLRTHAQAQEQKTSENRSQEQ